MNRTDDSETNNADGFKFWRETLQSSRFICAPMVDHSELAFRLLVRKLGVECTYSPMFNSKVFANDHKYRKYCLDSCRELDKPFIIQFCASNPEDFAKSAKMVEELCDAVDLNLGCPQRIAKRGHYGAFLQDEWPLVFEILNKAVRETKLPITCKIRVFEDQEKTIKYAQMVEKAGVSLIAVHGRTREQKGQFQGLADWKQIKAVKENVNVPVFANGNVCSIKDAEKCLQDTGVEGVMSAEGLLYNPALFHDQPLPVWEVCQDYLDFARQYKTPPSMVRGHMFKFLHHVFTLPQHEDLRKVVGTTNSLPELLKVAEHFKKYYQQDYETFLEQRAKRAEWMHPDDYPEFCCKPNYRHSESKKENLPEELNERKRKNKEEKKRVKEEAKKRKLDQLCMKCVNNQRGLKCSLEMCRGCCKAKTKEDKIDCEGHKRFFKEVEHCDDQETKSTQDRLVST